MDHSSSGLVSAEFVERDVEHARVRTQCSRRQLVGQSPLMVGDALSCDADFSSKLGLSQAEALALGANHFGESHKLDSRKQLLEVKGKRMYRCTTGLEMGIETDVKGSSRRLRERREAAGLTQEQLAKAARLSSQSVSNHERGKPMTLDTLARYAKALGCRAEDLADPDEDDVRGDPARRAPVSYPAPVVELLRLRRHLEIEPEELADLSRYVAEGHPDDVESLEIELLTRRASRGRGDAAIREFIAAVNRKRVAEGVQPWRPEPPKQPELPAPAAHKKRARA